MIDLNNENFLYFKSPAELDLKAMYDGIEHIKTNKELPRDLRILEDATGVNSKIKLENIDGILERMYDAAMSYNSIKHAVIHDKPENTAIALLFEHYIKNSKYNLKVFSTESAAKMWLLNQG